MEYAIIATTILISAIMLGCLIATMRSKRRVKGETIVKIDNSSRDTKWIMWLFAASAIVFCLSIVFTERQLTFLILIWLPFFTFFVNPVYAGENGLKAGLSFMAKDRLARYELADERHHLTLNVFVTGEKRPFKLYVHDPARREEVLQALDRLIAADGHDQNAHSG